MSENIESYLGTWVLIPELCVYQSGSPPIEGRYALAKYGGRIEFLIQWRDGDGQSHSLEFGGPLDGQKHPSKAPGISTLCYEEIDERTLDSTAFDGDTPRMYARRVASLDGSLLAVSQVIYGDEGAVTNFQVYRREGDVQGSTPLVGEGALA